jgi:hypothetical protein
MKTFSRDSNSVGVKEGSCSSLKFCEPENDATKSLNNDVLLPADMA